MIGGILWRVALLAVALLTAGIQLDRQSGKTIVFAESVPGPLRSVAQRPVAALALDGSNPEYALAEAERLVRRRPLPAEHLRILAQAQFAADDPDASALTIQYAARRGWREPLAQEAMLRLALGANDADEAARRYAALFLRRDTADALLEELGPAVLSEPDGEGRRTLAAIVDGGTRWHNQFLRRGARVMPPDAFAEIVATTIEGGTRYDCAPLGQVADIVSQRDAGVGEDFARLVENHCP